MGDERRSWRKKARQRSFARSTARSGPNSSTRIRPASSSTRSRSGTTGTGSRLAIRSADDCLCSAPTTAARHGLACQPTRRRRCLPARRLRREWNLLDRAGIVERVDRDRRRRESPRVSLDRSWSDLVRCRHSAPCRLVSGRNFFHRVHRCATWRRRRWGVHETT